MKPRIPLRERAKTAAQKAGRKIRAVATHRTTKRVAIVAGTLALAGAMWYYSRGKSPSPLRFMERPPIEYVEHVRKQFPKSSRAEALALMSRMSMNGNVLERSGLKPEDARRLANHPIGRALIWEGVLANGKNAAENESLTYYWGTSTRLGNGKKGFSQLEPDKQLGTMIYWGMYGKLHVRKYSPRPGVEETVVDVNTMSANQVVQRILRDAAMMQGRASLSEMVDLMQGKTTASELKRKHDW